MLSIVVHTFVWQIVEIQIVLCCFCFFLRFDISVYDNLQYVENTNMNSEVVYLCWIVMLKLETCISTQATIHN